MNSKENQFLLELEDLALCKMGRCIYFYGRGTDPFSVTQEVAENFIKEKIEADAPIATYKGEPVTKGTGRFGHFKIQKIYM